jgi:hypothetical protein
MQQPNSETARGKKQKTAKPAAPDADKTINPAQARLSDDEREQVIRQTAHAFYEARGGTDGYAMEDWLKAEAQFLLTQAESPAAPTSH